MSKELNLEAERTEFEAWALGPDNDWTPHDMRCNPGGSYVTMEVLCQWEGWLASRRASPAAAAGAVPVEALPPLPTTGTAIAMSLGPSIGQVLAEKDRIIAELRAAVESNRAQQGEPAA